MTDHPDKLQIDPSQIYRSFRRSKKHVCVYYFLCDHRSKKFTVREISAKMGIIKRDARGILEGMGEMYGRDESLEGMGRVIRETEIYHGDLIQLYSIVESGINYCQVVSYFVAHINRYSVRLSPISHSTTF